MSGGGFSFVLNQAGIDELAGGPEMLAFVDGHAERCLQAAQGLAPRESGEYFDSLSVTPARATEDGKVSAELRSSSWKWHWVEFGSINNQAHHVLERAVTESGLQFSPDGP